MEEHHEERVEVAEAEDSGVDAGTEGEEVNDGARQRTSRLDDGFELDDLEEANEQHQRAEGEQKRERAGVDEESAGEGEGDDEEEEADEEEEDELAPGDDLLLDLRFDEAGLLVLIIIHFNYENQVFVRRS